MCNEDRKIDLAVLINLRKDHQSKINMRTDRAHKEMEEKIYNKTRNETPFLADVPWLIVSERGKFKFYKLNTEYCVLRSHAQWLQI